MTPSAKSTAIEFTDAAVTMGGREVWSGVDVAVPSGQFAAVLGPNGAGKSTMLKALLGLLPLSRGSVRVLGEAPTAARGYVGYLPQRRTFEAGLRVRGSDIVRLGVDGHRWGWPSPHARQRRRTVQHRVGQLIELVGAESYAQRPIGELSGGEQQRLLIAQALAQDPALLLLDEPLDSLDLATQGSVASLIAQVCRDADVTVVMVAHDINPIIGYLDTVIYLAGGRAVSGAPTEVITSSTLSMLYQTEVEVLTTSDGRLVVVGQPEPAAHHSDRHTGHPRP